MVGGSQTIKWRKWWLCLTSLSVARIGPSDLRPILWERVTLFCSCLYSHCTKSDTLLLFGVIEESVQFLVFAVFFYIYWCSSIHLRSIWYICARETHMRSAPSLRSFPSVALETVPMLVWLMMALSRPLKEDRWALPLSTPLSSRRSMAVMSLALCPQVVSQAPQRFRSSKTQATCDGLLCPPVYPLCDWFNQRMPERGREAGIFRYSSV